MERTTEVIAQGDIMIFYSKDEYLNQNEIKAFLEFLTGCIKGENLLHHQYEIKWNVWKKYHREIVGKGDCIWTIISLKQAFENYYWPPGSYEENLKVLNDYSEIYRNIDSGSKCASYVALENSLQILSWGNVISKGSVNWLLTKHKNGCLLETLERSKELLTGNSEKDVYDNFSKKGELLMNSGTTKIFSFYSDGSSIIYDGRVGAALGLIVRKYLEKDNSYDVLPPTLDFMWGADRNNTGKRNPSSSRYKFSKLNQESAKHAVMNLRANWILEKVLSNCPIQLWGSIDQSDAMRKVEAALFMVGSDVTYQPNIEE